MISHLSYICGHILNSNSEYLGYEMSEIGCSVPHRVHEMYEHDISVLIWDSLTRVHKGLPYGPMHLQHLENDVT
jgi:hypothetical protein